MRLKGKLPYIIITLVGLAVYCQTLFFGYTYFDDNYLILENSHWLSNLANIWQDFNHDVYRVIAAPPGSYFYYRPLLTISFMLDAQWGRLTAVSFHLTNILVHLFAAGLLFIFLQKLNYQRGVTFLGVLIFTIHPALASAVAWLPGRNDSLLAVFVLLSFIFFIDYVERERIRDGLLGLIFFFGALLTKEAALVLIVLFWYYLRFLTKVKISAKRTYFLAGGWALAVAVWHYLRQAAGGSRLSTPDLSSMLMSLADSLPGFIQGLGKIFFPFNLATAPSVADTPMFYGYLAIAVVVLLLFWTKSRRSNRVFFGLLWFLLFLLPTQLVFSDLQLEHRLYLPIMGIIIVLLETDPGKNLFVHGFRGLTGWLIGSFLGLLVLININHSRDYIDRLTFWQGAARSFPRSAMVHLNLGLAYYYYNFSDEAIMAEYEQARRINHLLPNLHNSLGVLYLGKKMWTEAEREFMQELQISPAADLTFYNLGILYANLGKLPLAEAYWKKALAVNPERVAAYKDLAYYYYLNKDQKRSEYYVNQLKIRGILLDPGKDVEQADRRLRQKKS